MTTTLNVTCTHCATPSGPFEQGEHAQAGFCRAWNINNGLVPIWLCLACGEIVAAAWATVISVCKVKTVSLTGLEKQIERARAYHTAPVPGEGAP